MKKLMLLTITCCLLFISCNKEEDFEVITEKQIVVQQKSELIEEAAFITKVSAVLNKMVQNEEVFSNLTTIIEGDIMMLSNDTIRDDLIMDRNTVFEDNIMLRVDTIRDNLFLGKKTFGTVFTETYKVFFSEVVSLEEVLDELPKLYLGLPTIAFKDYYSWKENGYAITVEAYDNTENNLKEVSKKELLSFLGTENYKLFTASLKDVYSNYYVSYDDGLKKALATNKEIGQIITVKEEVVSITDFKINDEGVSNTLLIGEGEGLTIFNQLGKIYQTYIDVSDPNSCSSPYVFECNSGALTNYLEEKQRLANETCETYWTCLPVCCNGYIMYVSYVFEPTSLKCARAYPYLTAISKYSLLVTP